MSIKKVLFRAKVYVSRNNPSPAVFIDKERVLAFSMRDQFVSD
jgi:hypothetical protein